MTTAGATYSYDAAKNAINPAFPAKPITTTHPSRHSFPTTTTCAAFSVCVWLSKNPIGERDSINEVIFVVNNPIQFVDTKGDKIYYPFPPTPQHPHPEPPHPPTPAPPASPPGDQPPAGGATCEYEGQTYEWNEKRKEKNDQLTYAVESCLPGNFKINSRWYFRSGYGNIWWEYQCVYFEKYGKTTWWEIDRGIECQILPCRLAYGGQ